ncbi:hypothetical protein NHX12_025340, partial [Muraenolepis orangiensis]
VYVEFDDQEWEKREWVKIYEDFQLFLLQHQLVWAKRKEGGGERERGGGLMQGTKAKHIQWPALDEVDSLSPVLRDHPQLHEEVKGWLKDQKVQEIFMQGPYSLNGYRVRVYRQDSATQWFTGIITHHDLFSRNMVVMNDQVLEPQNVDPSMTQMTFLDDVTAGGRAGGTTGNTQGHYTRAQANSPRPITNSSGSAPKGSQGAMATPPQSQSQPGHQTASQSHHSPGGGGREQKEQRGSRSSRRKGSDSSVPEEEKERREDPTGRDSKSKVKPTVNKRRKTEDEEKKAGLKRLKTEITSDLSESSDSENPHNKRTNELKIRGGELNATAVPKTEEDEKPIPLIAGSKLNEPPSLIGRLSPWTEVRAAEDSRKGVVKETGPSGTKEEPEPTAVTQVTRSPRQHHAPLLSDAVHGCIMESTKSTVNATPRSQTPSSTTPSTHLQSNSVMDITEEAQATVHRESSDAVSALLASQSAESTALSPYLPLNPSPVSSPPVPPSPSPSEGGRRPDAAVRSFGNKIEFAHSEVIRPVTSVAETAVPNLHNHPYHHNPGLVSLSSDLLKAKTQQGLLDASKPKPNISPEVSRHKMPKYSDIPLSPIGRAVAKPEPPDVPRSGFKTLHAPRFEPGSSNGSHNTKSPLIIDKNETFTVYRDPALVRSQDAENSVANAASVSSNHVAAYLHPHLHSLHSPSPHAASHPHLLHPPPPTSSAHPHLLPPGVLQAMPPPPTASLLAAHPRLDSPGALGHLALAHGHPGHPAPAQQQQFMQAQVPPPSLLAQAHSGAAGLGLYPILWQYPNGAPNSYPQALNLPPGTKWVHPESAAAAVNAEASLRRSVASPWLHHAAAGSGDSLALLSQVPVRPASADAHRTNAELLHKDDMDKKGFMDPIRTLTLAQLKQEHTDRSRTPTGKDAQLHRLYLEAQGKHARLAHTQDAVQAADRASKYKEENRRILQESIEVAPFTAKIHRPAELGMERERARDRDREAHFPSHIPSLAPPNHKSEKSNYFTTLSNSVVNEPPRLYPTKELNSYYDKVSVGAVVSNIAATQPVPSQGAPSLGNYSSKASLSKPPPLIKHQPEGGEGLAGKITEHLSQQASLVQQHHVPMSAAAAGSKTSAEQQKPPTLLPELREVKGQGAAAAISSAAANTADMMVRTSPSEGWRGGDVTHQEKGADRGVWFPGEKGCGSPRSKPHAAMASVIVRPSTPAGTPHPSPNVTPMPGPISSSSQAYSPSFVHLKKHKAALAAAQSRNSCTSTPITVAPGSSSVPLHSAEKAILNNSPPLSCSSQASSSSVDSSGSCSGRTSPGKSSPLPNGVPAATVSGQSSNYHKLKKAWLTRHSEEDRNTTTTTTVTTAAVAKPEKSPVTVAVTSNPVQSNSAAMAEMIKPCSVNLIASTSGNPEKDKESGIKVSEKAVAEAGAEEKKPSAQSRRANKRTYESGSESAGDDSDGSESKTEARAKRQPKPTYKKKQNDMAKRRGDNDKDEEDMKPNGIFRSAREKTKLKLASTNGVPRSVLKDWRKVKKLKQTGESFLQDDSCSEMGPNLQKCRECRVLRSKKGEESAHSPVFCRFYYFRRLSYSKNGVIRMDGFSTPDQFDEEALALWLPGMLEESPLERTTAHYILGFIGDKFCQMVATENIAASWVRKDVKLAWKRAVRGVREMCDACEATLFNIHWVCQKCGFVVCLDCYKAKERKSSRDKDLYPWLKCVKGQPHDHKHLMPTQIIPGTVLSDLVSSMHSLRDKYSIAAHCPCKPTLLHKPPATNGVSQVLQNMLNHSNKQLALVKAEPCSQQSCERGVAETNGGGARVGGGGCGSPSSPLATPPESQSPLHFLADLAEQKSREEKKAENKVSVVLKEEREGGGVEVLQQCKTSSLGSNSTEQGSTLRDLLTTTAGKLRMGSTDAGMAFAPVYSATSQTGKGGRTMPNILDDIIASVVENKIPASRQNAKLSTRQDPFTPGNHLALVPVEYTKADVKKKPPTVATATPEETTNQYPDVPHCWLYNKRLLWLKDHRNHDNWKLFRECWKQAQPVLVSGVHKRLNPSLWKAESFKQEFADHQGDLLNCKDQLVSNSGIKEFWDGFEDITKRPKSKDGEPMGSLNLASHLPSFFVRPDLGPRLCCAYGVAASQDQDFGTANLHVEVSDIVSILVYVGVAKGNGVLSKTGVLKRLEEEDLDEAVKKRLKDSSETPGALWHIYLHKDLHSIRDFLHQLSKEQGLDMSAEQDPIREQGWYLSRKQRQQLLEEHGVQGWTVVQNLHSCVQVINDFVSPEHVANSFHLTQELRAATEEVNYEDKLQVKNILYHCVKQALTTLKREGGAEQEEEGGKDEEEEEEEEEEEGEDEEDDNS